MYNLYLVTDRTLHPNIETYVEKAILGGCTIIQLREKTASSREFYEIAVNLRKITSKHKIPLIINDRADIALAVKADGLHIGQDDLPYEQARKILGDDYLIGISTHNLAEAQQAAEQGADYIGVGAMFPSGTKTDASVTGIEELKRIRKALSIPIVAIGGINKSNISQFKGIGVGVAVSSAVVGQDDPKQAAQELRRLIS